MSARDRSSRTSASGRGRKAESPSTRHRAIRRFRCSASRWPMPPWCLVAAISPRPCWAATPWPRRSAPSSCGAGSAWPAARCFPGPGASLRAALTYGIAAAGRRRHGVDRDRTASGSWSNRISGDDGAGPDRRSAGGLGQRLTATLAMLVITASFPAGGQDAQRRLSRRRLPSAQPWRHPRHGGADPTGVDRPVSLLAQPFVTDLRRRPVPAPCHHRRVAVCGRRSNALRNIRIHVADPVFLLIEKPRLSHDAQRRSMPSASSPAASIGLLVGRSGGGGGRLSGRHRS